MQRKVYKAVSEFYENKALETDDDDDAHSVFYFNVFYEYASRICALMCTIICLCEELLLLQLHCLGKNYEKIFSELHEAFDGFYVRRSVV